MADHSDDKRMELTAHLQELRTRIMRSLMYLVAGAVLAYFYFTPIYNFMMKPVETTMNRINTARVKQRLADASKPGVPLNDRLTIPAPLAPGEPVTAAKFNELRNAVDWISRHPVSQPMRTRIQRARLSQESGQAGVRTFDTGSCQGGTGQLCGAWSNSAWS